MQGRPLARSIASMPAARPHPPNKKFPGVETPGVTGSRHLHGSSVGSSPRKVRASIGGKVAVAVPSFRGQRGRLRRLPPSTLQEGTAILGAGRGATAASFDTGGTQMKKRYA